MQTRIIAIALSAIMLSCTDSTINRISITEFGAVPNDGRDDTKAIIAALDKCRGITNPILVFENGEYDIENERSIASWNRIVTAALAGSESWAGAPPTGLEGWPSDKNSIISLIDFENLTVEGNDALLMLHGVAQPIFAKNCTNLTIKNLRIDYKNQPAITGRIVELGSGSIDVEITDGAKVESGIPFIALQQYDGTTNLPTSAETFAGVQSTEVLENGLLRLHMTADERGEGFPSRLTKGNLLVMRTVLGGYEPIEIKDGRDVTLQEVELYSGIGMGILGVGVENLLLDRVKIIPRPGTPRLMSTTADGTHFIGCRGTVELRDCVFEGEGDDHLNLHGQYQFIEKIDNPRSISTRIGIAEKGFGNWDNGHVYGWTSIPRVGETMEFCEKYNLNVKGTAKIASITHNPEDGRQVITFDSDIPSDVSVENIVYTSEQTPRLRVSGCTFGYGRSRGLLISTRDAVVENNLFTNNGGTSIFICAEIDWLVVPAPADITIRNNKFINCGYAVANEGGVITIDFKKGARIEGMNRNITISDNTFQRAHGYAIWSSQCEDIEITGNTFEESPLAIYMKESRGIVLDIDKIDVKTKVEMYDCE